MKNFTKQNFKTNPLWIRLLIMTFMLLIGTGSVWAQDMYVAGSMTNWAANQVKLSTSSSTYSGYYYATFTVEAGTYEYKIKESGNNWWCSTYNTTNSSGVTYTTRNDNCSNIQIKVPSAGTLEIYHNKSNDNTFAIFYVPCTKSISEESGTYENGEITLSAEFNTCGNAYIGFQWKEKNDSWCYDNNADCYEMLGEQNKSNEEVTTTLTKTGGVFVFRPYIVVGNNAQDWLYGTEFEVVTCSDPSAGYSISNENASVDWDGTEKEVIITTANGYATPSKIYYDGNETKPTAAGEYTITIDVPLNSTYCAATDLEIGTFTITCPTIAAPDITTSATVCEGTKVTLSSYNGDNTNTVKWYSSQEFNSEVTQQVTPTNNNKVYYAKAYHVASGCYSSEYSTLTFTVNPLPIISISGNNSSAVLYEDVTLTATGSDIDEVNWTITSGPGTLSNTTGTSVKLTSSTAGTVKVKATATSENDCTKESDELSVIFANETCNNVADMTKIYFDATGNSNFNDNVYLSVAGNEYNVNRSADCNDTSHAADYWPGEDGTFHKMTKIAGTNIYYVDKPASIPSSKISIWNKNQQGNNNVWQAHVILAKSIDNNNNCLVLGSSTNHGDRQSYVYCSTWTTYKNAPAISAPAAKTISVSTTDGEGNIIFSGQVVKTGCDATNEYGFQYSSDEQTWTTVKVGENAAAGTAISNNTVKGLDGTYYVRAYITNDNSTQYGAIEEITVSTKKYPITKVTLTHVKNQAGDSYSVQEFANLIYCAGETVWFKLEQDGSKFQDYQWISYPGTGLVGMYAAGTFSFTITDSGNVGIRLKNDANDDWVESNLLKFNTHPVAISPTISFENATICSNSTATLKLGALVVGQSYELYKEIENEGVYSEERVGDVTLTCNSIEDDLKFTGLNESGKYFVKGYTALCPDYKVSSQTATLEIVDASSVYITLNPTEATTTPWMPVKFTVNASDKYTLNVTKGNPAEAATEAEVSQNGNNVSVKIPLPEGTQHVTGQYQNVTFPQDATTSYTVTAKLVSIGGEDNPCAVPASATITLIPYVEECTIGH